MKKKKSTKKIYLYILPSLFILVYGLVMYSYFKVNIKDTNSNPILSSYKSFNIQLKEDEHNTQEILSNNFDAFLLNNDTEKRKEYIYSFLNNGKFYIKSEYDGIYEAYMDIDERGMDIYIPSEIIQKYFKQMDSDIREGRKGQRERARKGLDMDTNIHIEKDIDTYIYINKYLEYISSIFPQFNNLFLDSSYVLEYAQKQGNSDDLEFLKLKVLNILNNYPSLEDTYTGYSVSSVDNTLYIYPDSDNDLDISIWSNFSDGYDTPPTLQTAGTVRIPVLMFHQIDTVPEDASDFKKGLYISPDNFEKQIAYITRKGYRSIDTEEFYNILSSGINPKEKTVVLTFDDAVLNHYTNVYPILKKYNHTGVFFIPTARSSISSVQLKEMSDNGMDIQSHSSTHPDLSKIYNQNILNTEIVGSKSSLEYITGQRVNSFAYPGCVGNTNTFNTVMNAGYLTGFSCGKSIDHNVGNRFVLSRRHVPNDLEGLIKVLSGF